MRNLDFQITKAGLFSTRGVKINYFYFFLSHISTRPRRSADPVSRVVRAPRVCGKSFAHGPLKLPSKQDPEHHKAVYQPRDKYHDRMQKGRRPVAWWFGVDPLFGVDPQIDPHTDP